MLIKFVMIQKYDGQIEICLDKEYSSEFDHIIELVSGFNLKCEVSDYVHILAIRMKPELLVYVLRTILTDYNVQIM